MTTDIQTVADKLAATLTSERVSTTYEDLVAHSHDAWPVSVILDRMGEQPYLPEIVVRPASTNDVVAALAAAVEFNVPLTPWGLSSSVTGQPLATRGGIVLDMTDLTGEPVLNEIDRTITVGAGYRGGDLEQWLTSKGYTLNHFPQSLPRSTVGGWLSTRATGQASSRYGGIEQLVVGYEVVLTDGSVIDVGSRPRAAVGPDLRQLFLGAEGTLGVITSVTLKVFKVAEHQVLGTYRIPDVAAGLRIMRAISQSGLRPAIVRVYDESEAAHAAPTVGGCALFVMCEGKEAVAEAEFAELNKIAVAEHAVATGPEPLEAWFARRYDFSSVENVLNRDGGYAETIEVAHLWSGIENLYERLRTALEPFADEVLCHFSHVYDQGTSLYVILLGKADSDQEAHNRLLAIWETANAVTVECGGELSHHHGAGLARVSHIKEGLRGQHVLLKRLKEAFDPHAVLNPGKLGSR